MKQGARDQPTSPMEIAFDRSKSLQELEGSDWGPPTYDSYLVTTIHRLRRKPLAEFTIEDLRIMIGQNIALPYLVPLAIERLRENPFAAGDFYPGDLLRNVISVQTSFWEKNPNLWEEMFIVAMQVESLYNTLYSMMPSVEGFMHILSEPATE